MIGKDGRYVAAGVPTGSVAVTVLPDMMAARPMPAPRARAGAKAPVQDPGMAGMTAAATEPAIPIPVKYGKAETSGLTTTVKSGSNKYDISLQPR